MIAEKITFHITVNATVIGTLKSHQNKWKCATDRKKLAYAEAQKTYIKLRLKRQEES